MARGRICGEKLCERHVQALWYDRVHRPEGLVTGRGSPVRVIYPGEWNVGPGPDFLGAVLEIGGRGTVRGDVEVHLRAADWSQHHHADDLSYRHVIAHVIWTRGRRPAGLPRGAVTIELGRLADASFNPADIDLGAYPLDADPLPVRPCRLRLAENADRAVRILSAAGWTRLVDKSIRLRGLLAETDRTELFYREILAALGYSRNTEAFREVAKRVPYRTLLKEPSVASAALLAAGGFGELARGGSRPRNAAGVRLASAGRLFTETDVMSLLDVTDFSRPACRRMLATLCSGGFVGRGRAAAVLANVIAPFAIAEDRLVEPIEWLPPEDISRPVRLTAHRLFGIGLGRAIWRGNGLFIQGLIRIHRECCLHYHPECRDCIFVRSEERKA